MAACGHAYKFDLSQASGNRTTDGSGVRKEWAALTTLRKAARQEHQLLVARSVRPSLWGSITCRHHGQHYHVSLPPVRRGGGARGSGPPRPRPGHERGAPSRRQAQRGEGSQSVAAPRGPRPPAPPGAAAEGPGPPERTRVPPARGPRQREPGPGARGHREEGIGVPQGLPEARRGESGGQSQKAAERRRAHEVPRDA